MTYLIARVLSIHPVFTLLFVVGYSAFLWWCTYVLWHDENKVLAIVFLFGFSYLLKPQAKKIINHLKLLK